MPNNPDLPTEYITPGEAASLLHLSTKQVARLADGGAIATIRPNSHRRYALADVMALAGRK